MKTRETIVSKVDVTAKHPPEYFEGLFTVALQFYEDEDLYKMIVGDGHRLERGDTLLGLGKTERGSVRVLTFRGIKFVHPVDMLERTQRES